MAAYIDRPIWSRWGLRWCHLLADSLDELHAFAARLGLPRCAFQQPPQARFPHYDLHALRRRRALKLGAIAVDHRQIIAKARQLRDEYERRGSPPQRDPRTLG